MTSFLSFASLNCCSLYGNNMDIINGLLADDGVNLQDHDICHDANSIAAMESEYAFRLQNDTWKLLPLPLENVQLLHDGFLSSSLALLPNHLDTSFGYCPWFSATTMHWLGRNICTSVEMEKCEKKSEKCAVSNCLLERDLSRRSLYVATSRVGYYWTRARIVPVSNTHYMDSVRALVHGTIELMKHYKKKT